MKLKFFLSVACCIASNCAFSQDQMNDEALRYQQERMVFLQWDQGKFKPTHGFLWLNPYYWLTWGFFYPNYHKNDLRPLSVTGPQTQRLALAGAMNSTDNNYKLQSDTVRNTAMSQIASQSGLLADTDPLWLFYYHKELRPVLEHSITSILSGLPPQVSAELVSEGIATWYINELDRLSERIQAAHTSNLDRGARILAYHRLLQEYKRLAGIWAMRTASAASAMAMAIQQQHLKKNQVSVAVWSTHTDIDIANKVLQHIQ
jgi:hypothetical protein